jgi:prepilin-type N-terminal cleavage/methylation domain-containing protein
MRRVAGRTRARGFSLIELIIVVAVTIILAGMAVPAFGTTLARMRIQTNASQMVQDLRLVRDSAITYQQDLYVYIPVTSTAAQRTTYFVELSQQYPLTGGHYSPTTTSTSVSDAFVKRTLLYNMVFGPPVQSGGAAYSYTSADTVTDGVNTYLVLVFHCGQGSYFRGQPTLLDGTFSGTIWIPMQDSANQPTRYWYVGISPTGEPSSSGVRP